MSTFNKAIGDFTTVKGFKAKKNKKNSTMIKSLQLWQNCIRLLHISQHFPSEMSNERVQLSETDECEFVKVLLC